MENQNTIETRLTELLENEAFLNELMEAESTQELEYLFKKNRITLDGITYDETYEKLQQEKERMEAGELSDEQLQYVNGGSGGVGAVVGTIMAAGGMTATDVVLAVSLPLGACAVIGIIGYGAWWVYSGRCRKKRK